MEYMTLYTASFLRINLLVSSRFGEALRITQEHLDSRNFYAFNPEFDAPVFCQAAPPAPSAPDCPARNNGQRDCR